MTLLEASGTAGPELPPLGAPTPHPDPEPLPSLGGACPRVRQAPGAGDRIQGLRRPPPQAGLGSGRHKACQIPSSSDGSPWSSAHRDPACPDPSSALSLCVQPQASDPMDRVAQAWASPRPCGPLVALPCGSSASGCPGATLSRRGGGHIHGPAGTRTPLAEPHPGPVKAEGEGPRTRTSVEGWEGRPRPGVPTPSS